MTPRNWSVRFASVCLLAAAVLPAATPALLADVVSVDLGLTEPQPPDPMNVLELTVTAQAFGLTRSDSDSSTTTGNILARLGIEFDPVTHEVAGVDELEFTGGTIYFADVRFELGFGFFGSVNAAGTDISGTLDTPNPPGTVAGGSFPTSDHLLILNHGRFQAEGTGLIGGMFDPITIDLSEEPVESTTDMIGSLDVSLAAVGQDTATYDVTLTLPVDFDEVVYDEDNVVVNVAGNGTFEAIGQFTREVPYFGAVTPEVSTGLEEADVGATSFVRGPGDTELEWTLHPERVDGVAEVVDGFTDPDDPNNLHQFHVNNAAVVVTSERIDVRDFAGVQVSADVRAWQASLGIEGQDDEDIGLSVLVSYDGLNFDEEIFWLQAEGELGGGEGSLDAAGIVGEQNGPFVTFGSPLGLIPDGVQSLRVAVDMDNDSFSEHFFWDNVVISAIPLSQMQTLTWGGPGGGSWDSTSQWTGGEDGETPDHTTHVEVPSGTVVVDGGGAAYSLSIVRGGRVVVDTHQTLTVGTSLQLLGGTLGLGGTLDAWSGDVTAGVLTIGPGGSLNTGEDFAMEHTEYVCVLGGAGAGLIAASGQLEMAVNNILTVEAKGRLETYGDLTRTIVTADGPRGITGTFAVVPQVGNFALPPGHARRYGTYLGSGVWFGNDRTGEGVTYVEDGDVVTAVRIAVFQALAGDTNGNRDVSFGDFNALANNYTGSLPHDIGGKEWRQGDFDGDRDVDFGDFNNLANNYTGTGNWYTDKAATGGRATGENAPDASLDGADPQLIVDLGDGAVVMVGGPVGLNGYSVISTSGSLVPDDFPVPFRFHISNTPNDITVGTIGTPTLLDGELAMPWGFRLGDSKGEQDLVFIYGTSAGTFEGSVTYVLVPEPGTLVLSLGGALGLLLLASRRRRTA